MYRFAICDDDREFCRDFSDCLKDLCQEKKMDFTAAVFYDKESFVDSLKKGSVYDLVFLDILLKDQHFTSFYR